MNIPKLISKTKIMRGYQCPKSFYLTIHRKDLEPPVSPEQQAIFDQGNLVGEKAREYFPNGVLVDNKPWDFIGSLKRTRELLSLQTKVIYEAAFEYKGCYARADIIIYNEHSNRWSLYEVKSGTKLKQEYIDDVGLQTWIMANSGLPIEQINIMHLNPSCRHPDLKNLFVTEDVTAKLREDYTKISPRMTSLFKSIQQDTVPAIDIGPQCLEPYDCVFKDHCWSEKNISDLTIFNLPRIKDEKLWSLYKDGIIHLDDPKLINHRMLNSDYKIQKPSFSGPENTEEQTKLDEGLTDLQLRAVECFKTQKRFMNTDGLKSGLQDWKFPFIFLDFETINPAIPMYPQTGPYQQVPFQFSAHILKDLNSEPTHFEYLHTDESDPRPILIPKLIEACGTEGTIVSYFSQFESSRISEMAEYAKKYHPDTDHSERLLSLNTRMADPLPLIREHIYDNQFQGSFSLKNVGPALLGDAFSYDGMLVADGTAAQRAYREIIDPTVAPARKTELIQASLEYCRQDTLVMVELVKWMYRQIELSV